MRSRPSFNAMKCRLCGYDLRGLPFAGTCPECGSPTIESTAKSHLNAFRNSLALFTSIPIIMMLTYVQVRVLHTHHIYGDDLACWAIAVLCMLGSIVSFQSAISICLMLIILVIGLVSPYIDRLVMVVSPHHNANVFSTVGIALLAEIIVITIFGFLIARSRLWKRSNHFCRLLFILSNVLWGAWNLIVACAIGFAM